VRAAVRAIDTKLNTETMAEHVSAGARIPAALKDASAPRSKNPAAVTTADAQDTTFEKGTQCGRRYAT
jgi:hypothetical protein